MCEEHKIVRSGERIKKCEDTFPPLSDIIKKAEKEYNDLRSWAGDEYPGKCRNILFMFQILKKCVY